MYRESKEEGSDGKKEESRSREVERGEKAASLVMVMREVRWSREEDEEGDEGDDEEGKLSVERGLLNERGRGSVSERGLRKEGEKIRTQP